MSREKHFMSDITRRHFVTWMGTAASLAAAPDALVRATRAGAPTPKVKPIRGSWISVLRNECRHHHYWNDTCARFSREQWEYSVKEVADIGMEYLVLLATVDVTGKAFFDTPLVPKAKEVACDDPMEAMLSAADKYGVKFFISPGFYGGWVSTLDNAHIVRVRFELMAQLTVKYARHTSFYGWYLPDETGINPYYADEYIKWVNAYSREARRLVPQSKILVAPFGTETAVCDDKYVKQLDQLDVDIFAYQDLVGQQRMTAERSAMAFEKLRKAHNKVPQRSLWADVEVFAWDDPKTINTGEGALIPAPFARVKSQLEAVSPYVDVVTIYQYQGLMSQPGSKAPCGHPDATKLYTDYVGWLKSEYPQLVK
jgi:hypothetical protein